MKNVLSINKIITKLQDIPDDFEVNIQCLNKKTNPVGKLIVYPGLPGDLAFDMSSTSNVGQILSYLNRKTYLNDHHHGTVYVNRNTKVWATFPGIHSNLLLDDINISEETKTVTFVSKDARIAWLFLAIQAIIIPEIV